MSPVHWLHYGRNGKARNGGTIGNHLCSPSVVAAVRRYIFDNYSTWPRRSETREFMHLDAGGCALANDVILVCRIGDWEARCALLHAPGVLTALQRRQSRGGITGFVKAYGGFDYTYAMTAAEAADLEAGLIAAEVEALRQNPNYLNGGRT